MNDEVPLSERDPIAFALISLGFATNEFLLNQNSAIEVPHSFKLDGFWSLPSRMFRFPVETHEEGPEGRRTIGVVHPLLLDHPFVCKLAEDLQLDFGGAPATNYCGYSASETAEWWHAVDLGSAGLWDELLDTRRFTTTEFIVQAVKHCLGYTREDAGITTLQATVRRARALLTTLGVPEPLDAPTTIRSLSRPSPCSSDGKTQRWPVNTFGDHGASAWAMVLGIEHGWLGYTRSGYLEWTEKGRLNHGKPADAPSQDQVGQFVLAL
jgi:hypothetical protein